MSKIRSDRKMRFADILELWFTNRRFHMKGSTEHKYRELIDKHILPELGEENISRLTAVTVNKFLARKLGGEFEERGIRTLSASYVRSMATIIDAVISFAVTEKYCRPLKSDIFKPIPNKREPQILERDEQAKLVTYIFKHRCATSIGVLLSLNAGLRIGEVCGLSWENVDLQKGILHIRHTVARVPDTNPNTAAATRLILDSPKSASSVRDIPIASAILPLLADRRKKACSEFLVSEKDNFISPRTYEYRFSRLLEKSGLRHVNYHALRHTFATRCIEIGMDVKSLSEILGHAGVGVTLNTYVHSSIERKREQMEKLLPI